jgi:hypothetical protein
MKANTTMYHFREWKTITRRARNVVELKISGPTGFNLMLVQGDGATTLFRGFIIPIY